MENGLDMPVNTGIIHENIIGNLQSQILKTKIVEDWPV